MPILLFHSGSSVCSSIFNSTSSVHHGHHPNNYGCDQPPEFLLDPIILGTTQKKTCMEIGTYSDLELRSY